MKYAIFHSLIGDYDIVRSEDMQNALGNAYVRLSEWVEVEFPALATPDVSKATAQLAEEETEAHKDYVRKITRIGEMRKRLSPTGAPDPCAPQGTVGFPSSDGTASSAAAMPQSSGDGPLNDDIPYIEIDEGKYPKYESDESYYGVGRFFR